MALPLAGIRVVDVSEYGFVPSCAVALAELGADVIKVERLDGDAGRGIISSGMVPTKDGFDYLNEIFNLNKRGIALDITTEEGYAVLSKLVETADVFVTNQLPRVQRRLRTTAEDITAIKPSIVYARGHGQGQRGPDSEDGGFDAVSYWSRGGVGHVLSAPDAIEPAAQRPATGDLPAGTFLMGGICAALVKAARTGEGSIVDVSLLGSAIWTLGPDVAYASMTGEQMVLTNGSRSPITRTYRTSDGYFVMLMMINEDRYWDAATTALGMTDIGAQYADPAKRQAAWSDLAADFAARIGSLTRAEVQQRLNERQCIFSFFNTPVELLTDPAAQANGYIVDHPEYDFLKVATAPMQFDNEIPKVVRSAPHLGEHTAEILTEIGYDADQVAALAQEGTVSVRS